MASLEILGQQSFAFPCCCPVVFVQRQLGGLVASSELLALGMEQGMDGQPRVRKQRILPHSKSFLFPSPPLLWLLHQGDTLFPH